MGILLDGGFDTQRQSRGGTRHGESRDHAQSRVTPAWNLVLSYGDLSLQSGYRTRVLGELQHLDSAGGLDPFLLLFDRNPDQFDMMVNAGNIVIPRAEFARFFMEIDSIARKKPIRVVHAHNLYSAFLALTTRWIYGYKVVLDYGPSTEETFLAGIKGESARRVSAMFEEWVIRNVDHVIVMSRALGRHVVRRYGISGSRLTVIPSCVDSGSFHIDRNLRDRTRTELGLADSLICTHLGSLLDWHESDPLIPTFLGIRERYPIAHLLCITPHTNSADAFLARQLPPDSFTVLSATHERVPALLNASDLGFVLPRSSAAVETSSPAKFAEYLNCGVPVIITGGVGDFSSLVRHKGLGEVLKESIVSDRLIQGVLHSRSDIAERCARGGQELTWQEHRDAAKYVF